MSNKKMTKRIKYKGWLIQWNDEAEMYQLFTPEEMEQPAGFTVLHVLLPIQELRKFLKKQQPN